MISREGAPFWRLLIDILTKLASRMTHSPDLRTKSKTNESTSSCAHTEYNLLQAYIRHDK